MMNDGRPISEEAASAASGFPRRWMVWVLTVAATLGVAAAISGGLAGEVFRTLIYGVFLVPVVLPAWMLGIFLTQPFARRGLFDASPWPGALRSVVSVALGLGVLSLGTLLLGTLHLLTSHAAWQVLLLPAAAFLVGLVPTVRFLREVDAQAWRASVNRGDWLFLLAAVPAGMLLVAMTFAPAAPGALWSSEGRGYDVLAYHLELPREYVANNSTAPLPHNVYSCFPQNVEMLYVLVQVVSSVMSDDPPTAYVWGVFPAQFMHALLTLLTAAAVVLMPLGRDGQGRPWLHATGRAIGVMLFLGTPWTLVVGSLAYNEMGMMLYGTLALGFAMTGPRRGDGAATPVVRGVMVGVLLGLAVGCKLTAGVFFAVPVAAVLIWRGFTNGAYWKALITAVAVAVCVYLPWAVRAAAVSGGNPVFPVASELLGHRPWPRELAVRFDEGHRAILHANGTLGRLAERGRTLVASSVMDRQWSVQPFGLLTLLDEHPAPLDSPWKRMNLLVLLVPLAVGLAFVAREGRTEAGLILAVLVIQVLAWTFTTHLQPRFLLPMVVPLALLAGRATQGLHLSAEGQMVGGLRIAIGTLVGVQALCTIFMLLPEAGVFGGAVGRNGKLPPPIGQLFAGIWNVANDVENPARPGQALQPPLPPAHVLLLGDMTAWRFEGTVSYFSVFDVNPPLEALTQNHPEAFATWVHEHGVKYVVANWMELARLQDSYGLGLDVQARADGDSLMTRANLVARIYGPRLVAAGLEDTHTLQDLGATIYRVPAAAENKERP